VNLANGRALFDEPEHVRSLDLTRFGGRSFTFEPTGTHHAENTSTIPTEIQRPNH
jgi:hypothetical protein